MNTMTKICSFAGLMIASASLFAADFDGSKPILCASLDVLECVDGRDCEVVAADDVDAPQFISVDLKHNKIQLDRSGQPRHPELRNRENLNNRLLLQGIGAETGLGWTFSVDQDTGKFVLSASGDEVAFIIFGACTTLPPS
ncbi:MAG: hypothetical protein OEU90_11405 [Gammaproteobacteria bacterium]|nr:hypothetical protein [Gammaproteobacteria bacterium]MDH3806060.1 hypothetical protein [Gammaproteobacteria bacterium]